MTVKRRILSGLLAGAVVLVVLAACAPAVEPTGSSAAVQLRSDVDEWTAEVMGVQVHYQVMEEFAPLSDGSIRDPAEMHVPVLMRFGNESMPCTLSLHTSFMAGEYADVRGRSAADVRRSQVRTVASLLSMCLVAELIEWDAPVERDEHGWPEYSRWWYDVYLEECGPLLQPLGFPVDDGQCELPELQSILIPLDDA